MENSNTGCSAKCCIVSSNCIAVFFMFYTAVCVLPYYRCGRRPSYNLGSFINFASFKQKKNWGRHLYSRRKSSYSAVLPELLCRNTYFSDCHSKFRDYQRLGLRSKDVKCNLGGLFLTLLCGRNKFDSNAKTQFTTMVNDEAM